MVLVLCIGDLHIVRQEAPLARGYCPSVGRMARPCLPRLALPFVQIFG